MGLLYIMPASREEFDHVKVNDKEKKISLFSYGLPYIFWGYFLVLIVIEFSMFISIKGILTKLIESDNQIDLLIAFTSIFVMAIIPLFFLCMLFFQKNIIRLPNQIQIIWKVFGINVKKSNYEFIPERDDLIVTHLLESPNMAKINKNPNTRAFENQGHYILTLWSNKKPIFLDRHTRKQDLTKLAELIKNLD